MLATFRYGGQHYVIRSNEWKKINNNTNKKKSPRKSNRRQKYEKPFQQCKWNLCINGASTEIINYLFVIITPSRVVLFQIDSWLYSHCFNISVRSIYSCGIFAINWWNIKCSIFRYVTQVIILTKYNLNIHVKY